ncbi:glutamate ABC transporter substrate-binding protein [Streptomyces sp. NBC_01476]|uniref:glutamate ABC transporter substrate-binding protein n=1 Tax=Streptomyces sp. NBC_01476 TaxID=2903881 RepID=UPI002E2FE16D|nr:glutamate ABC transporter substrate-binding protein [Streptomyces sp. NBC_01476]
MTERHNRGTGTGRTVNGSWRGWGGVAAMAVACALALTSAVAPLHGHGGGRHAGGAVRVQGPAVSARYASTSACDTPEASLDPGLGSTDGAAVQAIVKRGRLRVGIDQNSYLWGFRDPATGQLAGFDIDIVKAIATDILGPDAKVQYLTVPTAKRFDRLDDGTVDMVVRTVSITCDRLAQADFSTAYFTAGQQLLVPDGSAITGYNGTLRGKTVCAASGSTGLTRLTGTGGGTKESDAQRFGATVMPVENQLDCLVRVQLGLADAVFTDNALAAGQAAQDPSMHLVGIPVTREPYGVAMQKGHPDLVRRVNRVLAAYEAGGADSRWMASYQHWLAADLPGISGPPPAKYKER